MKSKATGFIINFSLILILLLSSLATIAPARPVRAQGELVVNAFTFATAGGGTTDWTTAEAYTGTYSVLLTTTNPGDYAGFGLTAYSGTIDAITSLSYWYNHATYGTGCGPRLALTLTRTTNHYMAMTAGAADSATAWVNEDAISSSWWYGTWDGSNPATYSQLGGPINFTTLQGLLTTATVNTVAIYLGTVDGSTIYAGSAYIDDPEINGTIYAGKIQEAIDASSDGDTITVEAGTYDESVLVDKGIILQGEPGATIAPATGPGFQIDVSPVLTPVTIDGFTITPQESTLDAAQGITIGTPTSTAPFYDVTISNNDITTQGQNMGILIRGVGTNGPGYPYCAGLTVTGNTITLTGDSTAFYASWVTPSHTDWTITGNTFDSPIGVDMQLYDVENVTIDNNTFEPAGSGGSGSVFIGPELCNLTLPINFTNNDVLGNGAGSMVAFLCNFPSDYANGTNTMDDVTITGNTFDGWIITGRGLGIYPRVTGVTINQNSFLAPGTGLRNTSGTTVDAQFNYWGDPQGPSHTDATLGDITYGAAVSTDVDFMPWLVAAPPASPTGEIDITTTSPFPDGQIGVPYSQAVAATGGTGTYNWSYYGPGDCPECNFPPNLTLGAGLISGTPSQTACNPNFQFGIQADDGVQGTYKAFELPIYASPISITTASLPDAQTNNPYSETLAASGGLGTFTWSIYTGSLPPGLGINSGTGEISGTPTTAGTYNFRAKVVSGALVAYKDLLITIYSIEVDNAAASYLTSYSARLNGEVISTGGENVDVHIYWGTTDGGTTPGSWGHHVELTTPRAAGTFFTDITGLDPDTEYFFTCYIENSKGSDWADSTNSFTTLSQADTQKLIGSDAIGETDVAAGRLLLSRFQAEHTGHITEIRVYSRASGHVKVAVYEDTGSAPGSLINYNDTSTSVTASQWNTVSLPPTEIIAGNYYWLAAVNDTAGAISYTYTSTVPSKLKSITFSTFSFAFNNPPTGLSDYIYNAAFAGWGDTVPPPLGVTTNAATAIGDGIATLNGTLTSLGTDTSAVVEFEYDEDGSYSAPTTVVADESPLAAPGSFSAPVTGLSNGTTYHFRARATGAPSNDIVYGDDMTFTPTPPAEKLIGEDTSATSSTGANRLILARFPAEKTGNITEIRVYSISSGYVKVAVYDDVGGSPGDVIGVQNTATSVTGGQWNSITLGTPAPIALGEYYWLAAANETAGNIAYGPSGSGTSRGATITFSTFVFTDNPTGLTSYTYLRPFAGWGDTLPPALGVTTNAATAIGDGTATLNGTLTGLGSDTSAVVEFEYDTTGEFTLPTTVVADESPLAAAGTFHADLSSLSNGTEYHFRAKATGDPSATIVLGDDMTFTPSVPFVQLIGTATAGNGGIAANRLELGRFPATQTGSVTGIRVYSLAGGYVKVALYADTAGSPGLLLNANNTPTSVTGGQWNTITLPATPVTSGQYYWLAAASDSSGATSIDINLYSGTSMSKYITFSTFSFSSDPTSLTSDPYRSAFAGWGNTTPPALGVTTNAATAIGDGTATLNGTLTGLGSDTSAVVEFEYGITTGYGTTVVADESPLAAAGSFSYDLTGLSNGTEYHFRARATGDPSTDVVYGDDMTFTPNITPEKLIGSDSTGTYGTGANRLILGRFLAEETGNITEIRIYSIASGKVKVAVYEDSAGSPGLLLNANNAENPVTEWQWNTIPIATTAITSGNYYWLAAANDTSGAITYGPSGSGTSKGATITFGTFSFASYPTGLTNYSYSRAFAGWGNTLPPSLEVTTVAATGVGDGTATLNGSLTGLGTDDSAVLEFQYGIDTGYGTTVAAVPPSLSSPGSFSAVVNSGLVNGTTYHFRAKATGDPSTTEVYGNDMTFTPSATQKLVGSSTPGDAGTMDNRLILGRFQATVTGSLTQIRVYSLASGNVKVALYSDTLGSPGLLLNANNTGASVTGGQWNTITLPSTAVNAGTWYWLAAANDAAGAISYNSASGSGTSRGRTITFSSFTFTDYPSGLTSYTWDRAFAGWGTVP